MILKTASFVGRTLVASKKIPHGFMALQAAKTTAISTSQTSLPFTILSALAIAISYADRSNLSTAIIPMTVEFHWDSFFSGVVLSAFWGGYALTQVLGGKLADRFGGEKLLILAMVLWSVCTALTPTAAAAGSAQVVLTRILLGAGEGLALPAIHSMIQKYVKQESRATSAAIITAACYLGALLSNLLSPTIISNSGWRECFLIFAAFPPLIWLPLWVGFIYFYDQKPSAPLSNGVTVVSVGQVPASNNLLGDATSSLKNFFQNILPQMQTATETQRLFDSDLQEQQPWSFSENKRTTTSEENRQQSDTTATTDATAASSATAAIVPDISKSTDSNDSEISMELQSVGGGGASLKNLLASRPVWAIIAAQYGQSWGMIGLLSWLPTYYSQRFNVPLSSLSEFTVLPYFLQMFVAAAAGFLADYFVKRGSRVLVVRNVLQLVGMVVPAVCLAYCAYTPTLTASAAAAIITAGSAVSALTVGAVSCNHFDISPNNAGTVFGIGNTAACIGGLLAVPGSGFLYDKTQSWDAVFILFAVHYIGGALAWLWLADDKPIAADSEGRLFNEVHDDNDDGGLVQITID